MANVYSMETQDKGVASVLGGTERDIAIFITLFKMVLSLKLKELLFRDCSMKYFQITVEAGNKLRKTNRVRGAVVLSSVTAASLLCVPPT